MSWTASSSSDRKTSTRARERSAALSSKDGFSVVAPTSVIVPSSITGRNASSCARLKRWISSTKSSVPFPVERRPRAASKTFLRSATPEKIADIWTKWRSGLVRHQSRDRRLARARRPPEDQRAERFRADQAASGSRPARPDGPARPPPTISSDASCPQAGAGRSGPCRRRRKDRSCGFHVPAVRRYRDRFLTMMIVGSGKASKPNCA